MSLIHRAVTALVSSALAVSLVAAGEPAQAAAAAPSSPSGHGATWLAGQLNAKHLIHNPNFVPVGSTTTASPSTPRSR